MIISIIRKIIQVYALLTFVWALLSLADTPQNRWMVLLERIVEPAVRTGRSIAAKVLKGRRMPFDIGPLSGVLLTLLVLFVFNIIFS